jgi:hypothetical protein
VSGHLSLTKKVPITTQDGGKIAEIQEVTLVHDHPWLFVEIEFDGGHNVVWRTYGFAVRANHIVQILEVVTGLDDASFSSRYQLAAFAGDASNFPRLKLVPGAQRVDYFYYAFKTFQWNDSSGRYVEQGMPDLFSEVRSSGDGNWFYTVSEDRINLRSGPGKGTKSIGLLRTNTFFNIVDCSDAPTTEDGVTAYWYKIAVPKDGWTWKPFFDEDVTVGWIFGGYIYREKK